MVAILLVVRTILLLEDTITTHAANTTGDLRRMRDAILRNILVLRIRVRSILLPKETTGADDRHRAATTTTTWIPLVVSDAPIRAAVVRGDEGDAPDHDRPPMLPARSRSRSRSTDSSGDGSSRSRGSSRSDGSSGSSVSSRSRSDDEESRHRRRRRRHRSRSSSSGSSMSATDRQQPQQEQEPSSPSQQQQQSSDTLFSKDQRTVFVSQLTQKTTSRDLRRYFHTQLGLPTNEIILLRDRRTGRHKGSAYVELQHMSDVPKACGYSGQAPNFQRFPILIKSSEAEKNYLATATTTTAAPAAAPVAAATVAQPTASVVATPSPAPQPPLPPLQDPVTGRLLQAQKVYVGSLETSCVTAQHVQALFAPFGTLQQVHMPAGKGYAFLQYHDPREAALAIQTMAGQVLAGKPIKTGWATNQVGPAGVDIVQSNEFPPDAAARAQAAFAVLAQLTGAVVVGTTTATTVAPPPTVAPAATSTGVSRVPTVADARATLAAAAASASSSTAGVTMLAPSPAVVAATQPAAAAVVDDPTKIGNADHPTPNILVRNMFDKDQETEPGWETDIQQEFREECSKYGAIERVVVVSREPGGQIYARFAAVREAASCAAVLAGRWFDKRQLRVAFVGDEAVERVRREYEVATATATGAASS